MKQRAPSPELRAAVAASVSSATHERRERAKHAQAYEEMVGARPLKPPPMRQQPPRVSAGARALARDVELGIVDPMSKLAPGWGRAAIEPKKGPDL